MSEPDGRYTTTNGSTAAPGSALPGQSLADQPTEVVEPMTWEPDPHADTVVVDRGAVDQRGSVDDADAGPGFLYRTDDDFPDDEQRDVIRYDDEDDTATRPDYRDAPVVVRRADPVAGLLLLLAGIAAGVSLLVVWFHGGATGLELVRDGLDDARTAPRGLVDRDTWEPLVVVAGGVVLFLLGLLAYVPAKTHRFLGVLALLVSLVVAAAALVPLADADWDLRTWAVGAWCVVVVGGLGFLGALKALSTGPRSRR